MTEIDYCWHIYFFVINEIDQVRVVFNQVFFEERQNLNAQVLPLMHSWCWSLYIFVYFPKLVSQKSRR